MSEGYQGEELVFSAEGYGMDTWLWEFGESGTVDAYEQQVVYSYDIPGEYTISLQTNTTKYPVTPMQWNHQEHAGFTTGTPWLSVNGNYKEINVENSRKNPDSLFYYYKNTIKI